MKRLLAITLTTCLVLAAGGCSDDPTEGPTAADYKAERERLLVELKKNEKQAQKGAAAAPSETQAEPKATEGGFGSLVSTYTYQTKGRRDPFEPYRHISPILEENHGPLMAYDLEQLSVVAVVWDTGTSRALIADPRGDTHMVRKGTPIGKNDGLVIHIGDNMVLVKETYIDFAGETTTNDVELRIRNRQGG